MLDVLTVDDFAAHSGAVFRLGTDTHALRLLSATAQGRAAQAPGGRAGFSLLFDGPLDAPLVQGVHCVVHPTQGPLDIFLVPVGASATGLQYEAVFN